MSLSRIAATTFLSLAVAGSAGAQPVTQSVTIGVRSFGFTPQPIHLRAGQPVTLIFVNQSSSGHDFTAGAFFAAATITAGAAPGGEIEFRGHETRSITLVPRAGVYPAHCSHFMHSMFGMRDTIVVN
jgi:plastocyanin